LNTGQLHLDASSESHEYAYDYYCPIFTTLEFVFYVGWLKVAETLLNPFGEDDDDFDTNFLVDRNIQLCFLLIDQVGRFPTEPEKDKFWERSVPTELPYTIASLPFRREPTIENTPSRVDDAPIYMSARKQKDTESLRQFPSLTSMVSGIKGAVLRRPSINSSVWSLETMDRARKGSMRSTEEPNITRHGTNYERDYELPRIDIPCTIQEVKETDPPQARDTNHHHIKETDHPQARDIDHHHIKETDPPQARDTDKCLVVNKLASYVCYRRKTMSALSQTIGIV
jgi:hypothetical protein